MALPFRLEVFMKIEDIVLVKEHLRGKILNYLSTLDDFMMIHARLKTDSVVVIGQIAYGLAETRRDAAKWSTVAFTHNKVVEEIGRASCRERV